MPNEIITLLSREQFAIVALYHFLFVPLTLGLSWILFGMEALYVATGKQIYKDMVRFWGKLFGINFALGVVTGITMEFEFGVNWAYFSQYAGNVFGVPLAIEGLVAFMLESTFFGLFFFGWEKLSKWQHLATTLCLAIGSCFSALFIIVANGWMQNPVGAHFNPDTMRIELDHFYQLLFNPAAQSQFAHTISAGLVSGGMFVIGISAYYLLKGRDLDFAKRSLTFASVFSLIVLVSTAFFGDHAGLDVDKEQPMKMAAMEGLWQTPKAPAPWTALAWPNQTEHKNDFSLEIPYALSLIATHSLTGTVKGLNDIIQENIQKIYNGKKALSALITLRSHKNNQELQQAQSQFDRYKNDLGYGLLLQSRIKDFSKASDSEIKQVAESALPNVWLMFYAFRIMLACFGIMLLLVIALCFFAYRKTLWQKTWLLRAALYAIPLPFIACEFGWIIAEHGRQPWVVQNMLPTGLGASNINEGQLIFSLIGFISLYTLLFIIEMYLMIKYARRGPSALHTGRYHHEINQNDIV